MICLIRIARILLGIEPDRSAHHGESVAYYDATERNDGGAWWI